LSCNASFRPLVEHGDARAQYGLGVLYAEGDYVLAYKRSDLAASRFVAKP